MESGERRIHCLKLSGQDSGQLQQACYCLEEAFRLASLGGLSPHAEVLVRRLDLGTINPHRASSILADRITETLHELATEAVCVDHHPHADARMVWFSDSLQVYQTLLARLLDGSPVNQWYWRRLFPNSTLVLTQATVERLLLDVRQTAAGDLAPSLLLQVCLEPGRLLRLFSFLSPPFVRRLLHDLGLSPVVVPTDVSATQLSGELDRDLETGQALEFSTPWKGAVRTVIDQWGLRDVRTVWLIVNALVAHQPAYLEQKERLQQILLSSRLDNWITRQVLWDRIQSNTSLLSTEADGVTSKVAKSNTSSDPVKVSRSEIAELVVAEKRPVDSVSPVEETIPAYSETQWENSPPSVRNDELSLRGKDGQTAGDSVNATELFKSKSKLDNSIDDLIAQPDTVVCDRPISLSMHAGFAYLISLLQRVGMHELLVRHEILMDYDFPRILLGEMAERMGLPEQDPCRQLLVEFDPSIGSCSIERFCAPDSWLCEALARRSYIRRYHTRTDSQLLTEAGGHWPLFLGETIDPHVAGYLQRHSIQDAGRITRSLEIMQLVNAVQLVAGYWLRRHCAISLRSLVNRPGRMEVSPTHWDVIFELDQTDLCLRRVALDANPGWVPWLGRVVQFHFESMG